MDWVTLLWAVVAIGIVWSVNFVLEKRLEQKQTKKAKQEEDLEDLYED